MARETPLGLDFSLWNVEKRTKTVYSPRVVIMEPSGRFVLVRHDDTPWLGLPGGKVKVEETIPGADPSKTVLFRALEREVQEECGLQIHFDRSNCRRLGSLEINAVDNVRQIVTRHWTTIFQYTTAAINEAGLKEDVVIANLYGHLAGPLFPDARITIYHLRHLNRPRMPISPQRVWPKRPIFFQMKPIVGPLWGPPEWYK